MCSQDGNSVDRTRLMILDNLLERTRVDKQ